MEDIKQAEIKELKFRGAKSKFEHREDIINQKQVNTDNAILLINI
jgi:hypothetical protein